MAFLVAVPLSIYAFTLVIDALIDRPVIRAALDVTTTDRPKPTFTVQAWTVKEIYARTSPMLVAAVREGKIRLDIRAPTRKKDLVSIPVVLQNTSPYVLDITLAMDSQLSENHVPAHERRLYFMLVPGATITKTITVVVPAKSTSATDRNVYVDAFIESKDGDTLPLKQVYVPNV